MSRYEIHGCVTMSRIASSATATATATAMVTAMAIGQSI